MHLTAPIACSLVALGHFLLLAWPRMLNPFFGAHCWRHMLAAEYIRRHKRIPDNSIDNYLFSGPFDYPPLLPLFLALFTKNARIFLQAILSPLIETCHGVLVFGIVLYWTDSWHSAVLSQILFAVVPITALENSQLTARSPGSLFLTVTIACGAVFAGGGQWPWLAIALAAAVLIHLTHKMASQTLILLSLLAIPLFPWFKVMALIGPLSLLIALVLGRKLMWRILVGHVAVLRYYWRVFMTAGPAAGSVESPSLVGRLVKLAKSNPLVTAIGANPWIVLVVLAGAASWPVAELVPGIIWFWLGAIYVLIVTTTVARPLRFLGDGPRYSYYLSVPLAVAGGPLIAFCSGQEDLLARLTAPCFVAAGIAVVAGILVLQIKAVVGDKERSLCGDVKAIVGMLKGQARARVLVLPLCTSEVVAFFADCQVLSTDSALVHANDADFRDFNPRLVKPLSFFLERYDITHVVAENTRLIAGILQLPEGFTRTYDGQDYILWSRAAVGEGR